MDVLRLLSQVHKAGLKVHAEGDRLVITGPKSAADIAHQIGAHKPAVLAVLNGDCCRTLPGVHRPTIGGDRLFCPYCCRLIGADSPYPWSTP